MSTPALADDRAALVSAVAKLATRTDNGSATNLTPDQAAAFVATFEAFVDAILAGKLTALTESA
jgi:hypothetical protein